MAMLPFPANLLHLSAVTLNKHPEPFYMVLKLQRILLSVVNRTVIDNEWQFVSFSVSAFCPTIHVTSGSQPPRSCH